MIKNFVYLDSDKLRSISSQLFEGVTEHVLRVTSDREEEQQSQKGPVASGRILGDIFAKERSTSELKFLEDHAFSIFEDELLSREMLSVVDVDTNPVTNLASFVKVIAPLRVNDLAATRTMLADFNAIGEAFWRVGNTPANIEGPNVKSVTDSEARKQAAAAGMQLNKKFTDSAAYIIDYGYGGLLEASMMATSRLFSAPLKREFLRESENMILHKYSRLSQRAFTMLGMVTQRGDNVTSELAIPSITANGGLKEAMRTLALHLRTVEQSFAGPSPNEFVLDPVAIYTVA